MREEHGADGEVEQREVGVMDRELVGQAPDDPRRAHDPQELDQAQHLQVAQAARLPADNNVVRDRGHDVDNSEAPQVIAADWPPAGNPTEILVEKREIEVDEHVQAKEDIDHAVCNKEAGIGQGVVDEGHLKSVWAAQERRLSFKAVLWRGRAEATGEGRGGGRRASKGVTKAVKKMMRRTTMSLKPQRGRK